MGTKITSRATIRNIKAFENLVDVLNIQSVNDIPTRKELVNKIAAGDHTARDIWFAKMYKNGLNLKLAEVIRLDKYPMSQEKREILYHMEKTFPAVSKSKESVTGTYDTIKSHIARIPDYYTRKYIDIKPELRDNFSTASQTLNTIEKYVTDKGLPIQKEKTTDIFNYIEDMEDYDNIMRKIVSGIQDIPDLTVRRNILINLLGTRFDQNIDMQASQFLARLGDPERAWYNPKTGTVVGEYVKSGKKHLPPQVPLGPYMRDMMDQQWATVTNGGELATDVGMWDAIEGTKGGKIVKDYLFKITDKNPQGIFTNEEIELLGRVPKGFTDLRRLMLAWNARKTGNEGIADQLLGHGIDAATGKAITAPTDGIEMVSAVGRGHYLPGKPTPTANLRAFNIALEQNVAKLLGHKDYISLNSEWNVIGTDAKTNITGRFINDPEYKTFKIDDTVISENTEKTIPLENLNKQDLDFSPDPEIIKVREQERLAASAKATGESNFVIYQKALNLMNEYNLKSPTKLTFEDAYAMIMDRSKVKKPPIKLTGKAKEISDNAKNLLNKDGSINKNLLHNQSPATPKDIEAAKKATGADESTRAGRNKIKSYLKRLGKYMPLVSFGVGLKVAQDIRSSSPEAWADFGTIDEGPRAGQKDFTAQMLGAFGVDQPEEIQELRAKYETISGALPRQLAVLPPGEVLLPSDEEAEKQKQKNIELQNRLADEQVY